jgi:hypothetical protein
MKGSFWRSPFAAALGLLVLSACAAAGNGVPNGASGPQAPLRSAGDSAKTINLSGQYSGTVKDNVRGKGKANASFSQFKSALGGALGVAGSSAVADVSWTASGTTVEGTSVIAAASGYCMFALRGTYDTASFVLTGTYHAVHGCSGETGNYKLKHECTYLAGKEDVRPESGLKSC